MKPSFKENDLIPSEDLTFNLEYHSFIFNYNRPDTNPEDSPLPSNPELISFSIYTN